MIIYPGNHKIEADSEETTQSTLQLGYFREVDHNVNPRVKLEDDFCAPSKTLLYPYQQFKNKDILFKDKQGNTIESGDILRYSDGLYYFLPQDSVEYGPASFSYSVLLKKNDTFKNNIKYDISFKCFNDINDYASRLIGVFNNANKEKPSNLFFNHNDSVPYSMLVESDSDEHIDYIMARYEDFCGSGKEFLEEKLASHTNLWLLDESFGGALENILNESIVVTEETCSTTEETVWTVQNYFANCYDIRVWYNGVELQVNEDFYEAYYDTEKKIGKADEYVTFTNMIVLGRNENMKPGDVISYQIVSDRDVYTLENTSIYSQKDYELEEVDYVRFIPEKVQEIFPDTIYYHKNLFVNNIPVYILEKPGEGFIILSHPNVIKYAEDTCKLIFEIISHTFFQSYFGTRKRTQYIADYPIDYFIKMDKAFGEYHPRINLRSILFEDGYNSNIAYDIEEVDARLEIEGEEESIRYLGQDKYGNLLFRKLAKTDPEKKSGEISIFSVNNTIINYAQDMSVMTLIEEVPDIRYKYLNNVNIIIVGPLFSSSHCIDIKTTTTITKDVNGEELKLNSGYILYYDCIEKRFMLAPEAAFDSDKKIKIAEIALDSNSKLSCGDIRQFGGGEISSDNYEMIDSSSLKGRPYRVGSTMIIRLPKRFKAYRDILENEIAKHMASADYPILVFE